MSEAPIPRDPFAQARENDGVLSCPFQGKPIAMVLRYADVRKAANDWKTFSSDAPFRVPIPSEEQLRRVRQLPIETDPPEHTQWRKLVEPFFRRPRLPEMIEQVDALIDRLLTDVLDGEAFDAVREFALPLQSKALASLLNVDASEADEWIDWGTHVFRDGDDGAQKGAVLEDYLNRRLDLAQTQRGDDFFSALTQAQFQGLPLSREQMLGFANLAFAGGRDTIINSVTEILAYFAQHPDQLSALRDRPDWINTAAEEFVRFISPLTHIGRVCPAGAAVHGVTIEPDERASLCWASANYDPAVFDAPEELKLDRKPNPHIAYGSGPHNCIGAHHARLLLRTLLRKLSEQVGQIELIESRAHVEVEAKYERRVGYDMLRVKLVRT